jgi:hypothetical protein
MVVSTATGLGSILSPTIGIDTNYLDNTVLKRLKLFVFIFIVTIGSGPFFIFQNSARITKIASKAN